MLYANSKGKYDEEYEALWEKLVPNSGQAGTVQGELVRAIGRLASESYRNGNMNWDLGFRIMVQFLGKQLNDTKTFNAMQRQQIKKDLTAIGQMGNGSKDLDYCDGEDEYDRVTDRVVEWCNAHPAAIKLAANKKLHR